MILVEAPAHHGRPAYRLEFDCVTLRDMLHHLRLCIGIAPVGPGAVRYHGGIELLAEFPPQFRNPLLASLDSFCDAARSWIVLTISRA